MNESADANTYPGLAADRLFEPVPEVESTPVLERLGPSPFPRSGFPLMGFLATLYDHVSEYARERLDRPPGGPQT
jgi:hypothetical protein